MPAQTRARRPSKGWPDPEVERLRTLWVLHHGRIPTIAKLMGRTNGSVDGKSRVLNLQFHGKKYRPVIASAAVVAAGTTIFPQRVQEPAAAVMSILKSGDNQRKLGKRVKKGAWRGMPIFSLTLEERATCPRSCPHFDSQTAGCYGNNMGKAVRYKHGDELEAILYADLERLAREHPRGFVVRLHILGDFYSRRYVAFWKMALEAFPALHVFGYSARLPADPIGADIAALRDAQWDRFAVRTSGATTGPRTIVVPDGAMPPPDSAIICPAQTGGTACCATCALCWAPAARDRAIAFLAH